MISTRTVYVVTGLSVAAGVLALWLVAAWWSRLGAEFDAKEKEKLAARAADDALVAKRDAVRERLKQRNPKTIAETSAFLGSQPTGCQKNGKTSVSWVTWLGEPGSLSAVTAPVYTCEPTAPLQAAW